MPEMRFAKYFPTYVHDSMKGNSMTTQIHVQICIHSYILLLHKNITVCNVYKGQVTVERWKLPQASYLYIETSKGSHLCTKSSNQWFYFNPYLHMTICLEKKNLH